ncbi:MAG: hypothetical protein IKJ15_02240 [Lachnospiraceae bacterium]|nr:hypothetical protein [Lachnospiraceae bacterium]
MFRLILNIKNVDYNTLIDMVSEMVKKNKDNPALKGMKIPPMGFSMVKKLPEDKKNEMLAMLVNQDKTRTIQTLTSVIAARFGWIRILNAEAAVAEEGVSFQVDVGAYDFDRGIDLFFPKYLQTEDFNEALGDNEADRMTMGEFCQAVKDLSIDDKEVVFLRSIRMKKESFLYDLECAMREKGISAHLSELKILVRR